jgi:hypothetical protein
MRHRWWLIVPSVVLIVAVVGVYFELDYIMTGELDTNDVFQSGSRQKTDDAAARPAVTATLCVVLHFL